MQTFALMINNWEHSIDDVIGFMDGVSFATEFTSEATKQNAFYSGYECDTVINNVFAYGPDGEVFITAINCSGSWADGSLSALYFVSIRRRIGPYKIFVDQGFPRGMF